MLMTDRATASTHLNYRVAGVCINDGHVLLAGRLLGHARWPPRLLESSWDALLREMDEQIATRVTILRLLWIVENFYVHVAVRFHEISFYLQMALPDDSP